MKTIAGFLVLAAAILQPPAPAAADSRAAALALIAGAGATAEAAAEPSEGEAAKAARRAEQRASVPILWTPRANHGVPALREGGATRSSGAHLVVKTLVPEFDEAALTLSEQPELLWHLSEATEHPVNFTLVDRSAIDPLVDVTLAGPHAAGLQRIDLATHDARLAVGQRYEWYVAVVPDSERRSADIIARGAVTRVAEPELRSRIENDPAVEPAAALAAAGIWYDALSAVHRDVVARPDDEAARAQWSSLLDQARIELSE